MRFSRNKRNRRLAGIVVEVVVSFAILAVLLTAFARLSVIVQRQRALFEQRQLAICESADLIDRALSFAWDELNNERLSELQISDIAANKLHEPRLDIQMTQVPQPLTAKQIDLVLDWLNDAGVRVSPVRLTAWKYKPMFSQADTGSRP